MSLARVADIRAAMRLTARFDYDTPIEETVRFLPSCKACDGH